MKNRLKIIWAVCLLVFSFGAIAASEPSDSIAVSESPLKELPKYTSAESAFQPISSRLVLALFGKEAAVDFLGDMATPSCLEEIEKMTDADTENYTKPFPVSMYVVIGAIVYTLYIVAFFFWCWLISSFVFNFLFNKHTDEEVKTTGRLAAIMTTVRSTFVMALCVPVFGDLFSSGSDLNAYSRIHGFAFQLLGKSVKFSDEVNNLFSETSVGTSPRYQVPQPNWFTSSHPKEIKDLMSFASCVVSNGESVNDVIFKELSREGKQDKTIGVSVSDASGSCSAEVSTNIPMKVIQNAYFVSNQSELWESYKSKVDETIRELAKSLVFSSIWASEAALSSSVVSEDDFLFNGAASSQGSMNWYSTCDISSKSASTIAAIKNSKTTTELLDSMSQYYMCAGLAIVKKIGYPSDDFDSVNTSKYRLASTCGADGGADCMAVECGKFDPSKPVSNILNCSLSSVVLSGGVVTNYVKQLGFLAAPIEMYARSGIRRVPRDIQNLLSDFRISSKGGVSSFSEASIRRSELLSNVTSGLPDLGYISSQAALPIKSSSQKGKLDDVSRSLGWLDFLGVTHFQSCVSSGANSYINNNGQTRFCSDSIIETHQFGMRLLRAGVAIYAARSLSNLVTSGVGSDGGRLSAPDSWMVKAFNMVFKNPKLLAALSLVWMGSDSFFTDSESSEAPFGDFGDGSVRYSDLKGGAVVGFLLGSMGSSNAGGVISKVSSALGTCLLTMLFTAGALLAFVIPLTPVVLFYTAIIAGVANFVIGVIALNFHALYALAGLGGDVGVKVKKFTAKWALTLFRFPLVIIGFWLSIELVKIVIPFIVETSGFYYTMTSIDGGITKLLAAIPALFIYAVLFVVLVFALFDSVNGIYSMVKSLMFEDNSGQAFGTTDSLTRAKRSLSSWRQAGSK